MIDVPGGSFTSLILNPDATIDGTVDFTATTILGGVTRIETFNNIAVTGSGNNFFTFTTIDGQRFLNIAFQADGALTFADVAQFRIGGAQITPPPPPQSVADAASTLSLLGFGLAGIAAARRRLTRS